MTGDKMREEGPIATVGTDQGNGKRDWLTGRRHLVRTDLHPRLLFVCYGAVRGPIPDIEFRYRLTLADARHSSWGVSAFGGSGNTKHAIPLLGVGKPLSIAIGERSHPPLAAAITFALILIQLIALSDLITM